MKSERGAGSMDSRQRRLLLRRRASFPVALDDACFVAIRWSMAFVGGSLACMVRASR